MVTIGGSNLVSEYERLLSVAPQIGAERKGANVASTEKQDVTLQGLQGITAAVEVKLGDMVQTIPLSYPERLKKDGNTAQGSPRRFSTGSAGYTVSGARITGPDGREFMVQVNLVQVGSKDAG